MTAPKAPLTAREVAERLDTDPKTFRVFLRATGVAKDEETGRYVFKASEVAKLTKAFNTWQTERSESRKVKAEAAQAAKREVTTDDE